MIKRTEKSLHKRIERRLVDVMMYWWLIIYAIMVCYDQCNDYSKISIWFSCCSGIESNQSLWVRIGFVLGSDQIWILDFAFNAFWNNDELMIRSRRCMALHSRLFLMNLSNFESEISWCHFWNEPMVCHLRQPSLPWCHQIGINAMHNLFPCFSVW